MKDTRLIEDVIPSFKDGRRLGLTDEETEKYAKETYDDMVRSYDHKASIELEVGETGEAVIRCMDCGVGTPEDDDVHFCRKCGARFVGG